MEQILGKETTKMRSSITVMAHILSCIMLFFLGLSVINNAPENEVFTPYELSLLIICVGVFAAWRSQEVGGWLIISGIVSYYSVALLFEGNIPANPFLPACLIPGLLYLSAAYANTEQGIVLVRKMHRFGRHFHHHDMHRLRHT